MSADPARSMVAATRLIELLDDRTVHGDLLLVGVALVALVDLHHEGLARRGSVPHDDGMPRASLATLSDAIGSPRWRRVKAMRDYTAREAILRDRRRYESRWPGHGAPCEAPMVRRPGYCGNDRGGSSVQLRDYATGEIKHVSHCARHREWAEQVRRDNAAEAPNPSALRGGAPEPYANAGGRLAEHFPELDWPKLWTSLDPRWTPPPERTQPPRPRFELLIGDDESSDGCRRDATGGLRLVPSGRELRP